MSIWSRFVNLVQPGRVGREIDEELESHLEEAVERGRDPVEARRAFGSALQHREHSLDLRLFAWFESLRADVVFGWRQILRRKVTSAAAILSLGLALGACISAFRLIDALLLRPLPVADPDRLYSVVRQGQDATGTRRTGPSFAYPAFQQMRQAVRNQAELIATSWDYYVDVTYKSDAELEKVHLSYVSGWMFGSFGLRPAAGRLLSENDDVHPGGHPVAVISRDYWSRRFGRDTSTVGRTFRFEDRLYEIVGVIDGAFTGTSPGTVTDIFIPVMMNSAATRDDASWIRILAQVKAGAAMEPLRARLDAASLAFERERTKSFTGMARQVLAARFLAQTVVIQPAAAGASDLQEDYRRSLLSLGVLVLLVLVIAATNIANLMTARAVAREREMALRVSIGAGRARLLQLLLVESAVLSAMAAIVGGIFAWWSAPFVVSRINPPNNPARLDLPADWRVLGFGLALLLVVTCLFGLAPALRASAIKPMLTLRGGTNPHTRRRMMHVLIAVQVAFCFLVLFGAGMFAATFDNLLRRPIGFSPDHLLAVDTVAHGVQPPEYWDQVAARLRQVPGIDSVSLCGWPLLRGSAWNGFVSVNGIAPSMVFGYFLNVSPGWLDTMKIPLIAGRDFTASEESPGAAIVNETFVRQFLPEAHPLGMTFKKGADAYQVVGVVRDAPYRNIRDAVLPVAYVPFYQLNSQGARRPIHTASVMVRTKGPNPMALASLIRRTVPEARPEIRVSTIVAQTDLVQAQTVRERLLAMLASFFAVVALLLAAIGLYGVLDYSVLQRRREIGIRIAIGAGTAEIAQQTTRDAAVAVVAGAAAGISLGLVLSHNVETLLYGVKPTDMGILIFPSLTMLGAAVVAALPAVVRAVRTDPVAMLRSE